MRNHNIENVHGIFLLLLDWIAKFSGAVRLKYLGSICLSFEDVVVFVGLKCLMEVGDNSALIVGNP